ncbi:MAG: hypothetical protein AABZ57_05555 [Candidatus Margulisiibacteriota bacterium]
MPKLTVEVNKKEIERLVESLPAKEKLQLVRNVGKNAVSGNWGKILKDIDSRLEKLPVSEETVLSEITAYRKSKRNNAKARN